MIRSELVLRVAEQNPHLYAKEIEAVVDAILDRIVGALANGDRVEIRGFGVFETKRHEARTGRNPHSGAVVEVPPRTSVTFKTSKRMRAQINREKADPEQAADRILRDS